MADFYVRPLGGSYGAEDGTSYADAWDGFANVAWGAAAGQVGPGDTLWVCGAHTQQFLVNASGTDGNVITIRGDYPGDAGSNDYTIDVGLSLFEDDYVTVRDISLASTDDHGLRIWDCTNTTVQDVTFPGSGLSNIFLDGDISDLLIDGATTTGGQRGIYWAPLSGATSTLTDIEIRNCTFTGASLYGLQLQQNTGANAASIITRLSVHDNESTANLRRGVIIFDSNGVVGGSNDLLFYNNNVSGNGTNEAVSSGTGGCVLGGFGSSTGDYGKNLVYNNTFSNNIGLNGGLNVFDCEYVDIYDNVANGNTITGTNQTIDGYGILLDDDNSYMRVFRNEVSNNSGWRTGTPPDLNTCGVGIGVLKSDNVLVYSNKGIGNRGGGYWGGGVHGPATNSAFYNNAFAECTNFGFYNASSSNSCAMKNNIFTPSQVAANESGDTKSIHESSSSGPYHDKDYNCFYGFDTATLKASAWGDNNLNDINPNLDANQRPTNPRLSKAGIAVAGITTDYNGKTYKNPPSIGAVELRGDSVLSTSHFIPPMDSVVVKKRQR